MKFINLSLASAALVLTTVALSACDNPSSSNQNQSASSDPASASASDQTQAAASTPASAATATTGDGNFTVPSSSVTAPSTSTKSDDTSRQEDSSESPTIKGLALGETPAQVTDAMRNLASVNPSCTMNSLGNYFSCEPEVEGSMYFPSGTFNYDSNGKLISMSINSMLSDKLFGSMSPTDFKKNFTQAYNIPNLEVVTDDPNNPNPIYRYRDQRNGWEILIGSENNGFVVERIATANQVAKQFN